MNALNLVELVILLVVVLDFRCIHFEDEDDDEEEAECRAPTWKGQSALLRRSAFDIGYRGNSNLLRSLSRLRLRARVTNASTHHDASICFLISPRNTV